MVNAPQAPRATRWILAAGLALAAACASAPNPVWVEALGVGAVPPWRKEGDGRMRARNAATTEAHQKIFQAIRGEKVDENTSIVQLALMRPAFRSKLFGMIAELKGEEVPSPDRRVVLVKVRVDKNQVLALARRHLPSSYPTAAPASAPSPTPPATETPSPAPTASSSGASSSPAAAAVLQPPSGPTPAAATPGSGATQTPETPK